MMLPDRTVIIHTFYIDEKNKELFFNFFREHLPRIREVEGCQHAFLYQFDKDANKYMIAEIWDNENAWKNFIVSRQSRELALHIDKIAIKWESNKLSLCPI